MKNLTLEQKILGGYFKDDNENNVKEGLKVVKLD